MEYSNIMHKINNEQHEQNIQQVSYKIRRNIYKQTVYKEYGLKDNPDSVGQDIVSTANLLFKYHIFLCSEFS